MPKYIRSLPKNFVVYDLEFTDPKICKEFNIKPEIIEVGACMVGESCNIEDTFYSVCKPKDMRAVSPFIKDLTGMNYQEIESADPWDKVWPFFNSFVENKHLMSWTWKDHEILSDSSSSRPKWRQPMFDAMSFTAGFSFEWGLNMGTYGLKQVKDYFGIETEGHRALQDAKDVVEILKNLQEYGNAL